MTVPSINRAGIRSGVPIHQAESTWLSGATKILVFAMLLFAAVDGPIRYYLGASGLFWITYVPKALLGVLFPIFVARAAFLGRLVVWDWILLGALVLAIATGCLFTASVNQVAFGLFVITPVLAGRAAYGFLIRNWDQFAGFIGIIFLITIVGVLLDHSMNFPWVGYEYSIGDYSVRATRQWFMSGFERLGGFTRSATSAAGILIFCGTYLVCALRNKLATVPIWSLTGLGIFLTTSKGLIACYVLITLLLVFRRIAYRPLWYASAIALTCIGILLPLLSAIFSLGLGAAATVNGFDVFRTLRSRMLETWPSVWELMDASGSTLLGRGIGGVGVPQQIYEPNLWIPVDNLYVYLFGSLGVGSLVAIAVLMLSIYRTSPRHGAFDLWGACLAITVLGYGVTNAVVQGAYLAFATGILFGRGSSSEGAEGSGLKTERLLDQRTHTFRRPNFVQ